MDTILLKILLWLVKTFAGRHVDFDKLTIIAQTKIMMDRRRSPATWKRSQKKEHKNPLLFTLIMYGFLGMLIGSLVFYLNSLLMCMILLHSYVLFMMAMTLITDFSSVLLDTADNQIILPKPVNSRTLFLSRVVHILVYLLQFMIAIAAAPIIFTFIKYGLITGLVTLLTMLLTVTFAVFVTYLLYTFILRFGNEQKIKDIIGYFQVFMTVFFAVGYQVIPRFIDFDNSDFSFNLHWYSYLLAPVWMGMTTEAVHDSNYNHIHLLMIACTVIIPILTTWLMIKFFAPSFSRKLAALNNNTETVKTVKAGTKSKTALSSKLASIFCSSKTETAGFEKVWKITGRDKSFKVQFYPSLAYLLVFAFIFVFKSGKNVAEIWKQLPTTNSFLWFVYLPLMSISSSLNIIPFNENFGAAWIYQAVPLEKPGAIISGMVKALLVKFFIPVYLILFAFAFYVWGPVIIDDFAFGLFNNVLIFVIMANLIDHYFPFSQQANIKQQTGKFVRVLVQLVLVAILIGLHYLALNIYWLPAALIPVSAAATFLLLKRIQDLPWLKISV